MVSRKSPKVKPGPATDLKHGIELFNRQAFFECHEVLEELWKPARGPRRLFLQSVIHLAVAFYHHQQRNPAGAARQLRKGLKKLAGYLPEHEGINTAKLYREALTFLEGGGTTNEFPKITGT
jgi:predicted metal-dependent hydrolase